MGSTSKTAKFLSLFAVFAMAACSGSPAPSPTSASDSLFSDTVTGEIASSDTATNDSGGPACIDFSPATVAFPILAVGTAQVQVLILQNCSTTTDLVVTSISLAASATPSDFAFKLLAPGSPGDGAPPTLAKPLVLMPGKSTEIQVTFAPLQNTGLPQQGTLVVESSAGEQQVPLTGQTAPPQQACPAVKISAQEGEQVLPTTLVHLGGVKLGPPAQQYAWSVSQPPGASQTLQPSASVAAPTFLVTVAGTYTFCLQVWDGQGSQDCPPACTQLMVTPNSGLYAELWWQTPGEPTPTALGPGSDLDLHLAHAMASQPDYDCDGQPDPWFSNPFDCFWFNYWPEWDSGATTKDNPAMDLDDRHTGGYEYIKIEEPAGTPYDVATYSLGVHYWNDHGFGPATATAAVYVMGAKVAQYSGTVLQPGDFWYVGKIAWPNLANGGSQAPMQACWQSGASCPAKKSLMWQPSGAACITACYPSGVLSKGPGDVPLCP